MKTSVDITIANPDLAGFDLENMKDLGAHSDGSGGGIRELAWQLAKLRETRERVERLQFFIRKHQMTLARLSWSADVDTLPPVKRDDILFVPEIELCCYTFDRRPATAKDIMALWPGAEWSRSMPNYSIQEDRVRDYTAEIDGVIVRIRDAERRPAPVKMDPFSPCGPLKH